MISGSASGLAAGLGGRPHELVAQHADAALLVGDDRRAELPEVLVPARMIVVKESLPGIETPPPPGPVRAFHDTPDCLGAHRCERRPGVQTGAAVLGLFAGSVVAALLKARRG